MVNASDAQHEIGDSVCNSTEAKRFMTLNHLKYITGPDGNSSNKLLQRLCLIDRIRDYQRKTKGQQLKGKIVS